MARKLAATKGTITRYTISVVHHTSLPATFARHPSSRVAAASAGTIRLAPRSDDGSDTNDDGDEQEIGQNDGRDSNDSRIDLVVSSDIRDGRDADDGDLKNDRGRPVTVVTLMTVIWRMIAVGPCQ